MSLIASILARNIFRTEEYLKTGEYNVNALDLAHQMADKHNPEQSLVLSSLVHIAVSANDPRILLLLIRAYNAKVSEIEERTPSKFLAVLTNRIFDTSVTTFSALKNIDILYQNGASIPDSVVRQLFIDYDHMPLYRENVKMVIKKLYILKVMDIFLDHVKNNRLREAREFRYTNINQLFPELQRLGITGHVDPNYDAGVHGIAVLIAAEHPSTRMLEFLSTSERPWQVVANLTACNSKGLTILHIFAMRNNLFALEWISENLQPKKMLKLLGQKVTRPDGQQYTARSLAIRYNFQQIITFLKEYADRTNDYLFDQIKEDNPDSLRELQEVGFRFTSIHSATKGNPLHYSVLGKVPANTRWIWNQLPVDQQVEFLLAKVQYLHEGNIEMVTPLQLAQKLRYGNFVGILQELAIKLAGTANADALKELALAGYDFSISDLLGRNALYYAILGNNVENIKLLFLQMTISDIAAFVNKKMLYQNELFQECNQTPLEIAQERDSLEIVALFQTYIQLGGNLGLLRPRRELLRAVNPIQEQRVPVADAVGVPVVAPATIIPQHDLVVGARRSLENQDNLSRELQPANKVRAVETQSHVNK